MSNQLAGHHLMRVRVRKRMFLRLQETAEEMTEEFGEHVTVSDIVRRACYEFLNAERSRKRLDSLPAQLFEPSEGEQLDVLLVLAPMLD